MLIKTRILEMKPNKFIETKNIMKHLVLVSFSLLAGCSDGLALFQYNDVGSATVIDGGGNIVVAGYSWNGRDYDMTLWRYDASGMLDNSFGTNGIVTSNKAAGDDRAYGIAIDGTGIIVVGTSFNGTDRDMTIWRYDNTGALDTTFNTTGIVTHDNAAGATTPGEDFAYGVALDGTDIIVTGESWNGSNYDMAIWRYDNTGALDTTFNTTGIVTHDNAAGASTPGDDTGFAITLDGTDIIIAGASDNGVNNDMAIWRYDNTGALDTTFNTTGIVTHDNAAGATTAGNDAGYAVALVGTDIVVAGTSFNGNSLDMAIWRYDSTGALVTGFNSGGIVTHDNAAGGLPGRDIGRGIAVDGTDILVVGESSNGADQDMAAWRYDSSGVLVTSFSGDGIVISKGVAGGLGTDSSRGIAIDSSHNVVVAGYGYNGNDADMVLWRYTSAGVLDTTFNSNGYVVDDGAAR